VSVGINVSVSSLVCSEAWGTEPTFSWLHERAAVTAVVGRVSADGKTLVVSHAPLCGHFTCMVSNKLGYSSATYTAGKHARLPTSDTYEVKKLDYVASCGTLHANKARATALLKTYYTTRA